MTPVPDQASARTRAYARVLGPFMMIVPGVVAGRAPQLSSYVPAFFENEALVWVTGCMMLGFGLLVISQHQYWSSVSAAIISLFGWFSALRGLALLGAPHWFERVAADWMRGTLIIQLSFGMALIVGLWLTHAGWIARPTAHPVRRRLSGSSGFA